MNLPVFRVVWVCVHVCVAVCIQSWYHQLVWYEKQHHLITIHQRHDPQHHYRDWQPSHARVKHRHGGNNCSEELKYSSRTSPFFPPFLCAGMDTLAYVSLLLRIIFMATIYSFNGMVSCMFLFIILFIAVVQWDSIIIWIYGAGARRFDPLPHHLTSGGGGHPNLLFKSQNFRAGDRKMEMRRK